jgi:MOSC domain-containing protein YiiM
MQLVAVNLGTTQVMTVGPRQVSTGIYKTTVQNSVYIGTLGLQNDSVCDTQNHGGPDQAVYVYGTADYAWWSAQLGRELVPGTFGENLTVSDLESGVFVIGDRLQIGAVLLEVTAPRIPCSVFATRMGEHNWINRFRDAGRPGLYCRVMIPGRLQAGDAVSITRYDRPTVTIPELFGLYYEKTIDVETLRRLLAAPIDIRARYDYAERYRLLTETVS